MSESGHRYLESHQIGGERLLLDIEGEASAVLQSAATAPGGQSAKTLVKEGPLRVVIIGLKSGASVREHTAGGPVTIHVLSGRVNFSSSGQGESVDAGRAVLFATSVPHSLDAEADSVVLLTIAWPES
jgi:quercetin dioxygenase-like cupin family protein